PRSTMWPLQALDTDSLKEQFGVDVDPFQWPSTINARGRRVSLEERIRARSGTLSSDGKYLATYFEPMDSGLWRRILAWFGLVPDLPSVKTVIVETVFNELILESPGAGRVLFTVDGGSAVIAFTDRTEVWDLPPPRPWRTILFI